MYCNVGCVKVLYNDHRVERRQLLDELVIGTEEAFPLPKLTQVRYTISVHCVLREAR